MKIYKVDNLSPLEKLLIQAYMDGMRDGSYHKAYPMEWLKNNTEAVENAFREELSVRRNSFKKHPPEFDL